VTFGDDPSKTTRADALVRSASWADSTQFTDDAVHDPTLVALRGRVEVIADAGIGPYAAKVTIVSGDGAIAEVTRDTGTRAWRLDPTEQQPALVTRFPALTTPNLGVSAAKRVVEELGRVEELADIRPLIGLLVPGSTPDRP
jgi:hypothetical protein